MRIVVRVSAGYEELQQELTRVPAKQRAERLRLLASMGLFVLQNRSAPFMPATAEQGSEPREKPDETNPPDPRRNRLKSKLQQSLQNE